MKYRKKLSDRFCLAGKQYILLTGATGLVGRYLLRDLLLRKERVAVIARPSARLSARQRVEAIMQHWERELGSSLPRPLVIEGDICCADLGMSEEDSSWVSSNCRQVVHNAAILQFDATSRKDEPFRTNLGGTERVLEVTQRLGIPDFHYVSTAYVCGKATDTVFEDQLDVGQELRNDYEQSKFESEKLVRAATGFRNVTIFRPAVIIGDSETGYTSTYHGLFLYLRLISMLVPLQKPNAEGKRITPIQLPMSGDEPRNLVPVDWVASVIAHVICTPAAHGRTFHLTPQHCTSAAEVIDSCCNYFNSEGVTYALSDTADKSGADEGDEFARKFFENARIYESYVTDDPDFDRRNVEKWAGHLPCPVVDEAMIHRFIEFGESNRWGKTRSRIPEVDYWFEDELGRIGELAETIVGRHDEAFDAGITIGLDIKGPGGGQWTLVELASGVRFERGVPAGENPLLVVDGKQVAQLLDRLAVKGAEFSSGSFADEFENTISLAIR